MKYDAIKQCRTSIMRIASQLVHRNTSSGNFTTFRDLPTASIWPAPVAGCGETNGLLCPGTLCPAM